ncbi:MAG: nucleotide sugar dehydrogenase [Wenzhouxiangellaceae bacterium]
MTQPTPALLDRLRNRESTIGIVGLGYVGLPLLLRYSEAGYRALGFDVDPNKVEQLNAGRSYIAQFESERVARAVENGAEATADPARIAEADAVIICVPTPLNQYREPDLSFVIGTVEQLAPHLRKGQVVSLESTTYPGTTEEELLPRIEAQGLTAGKDIFLVYSPEREDPGNKQFETRTIPKVVGGHTPACLEAGKALYEGAIDKIVPVSSTRAAEMTKLLENIHRAVNIGLVNEMKVVADAMDIDIFEVIDAAASKPFGFTAYYPGPGLGGHCIPIDPFYLTWKAREYGLNTRFIELSGEVNRAMPEYVVTKIMYGLNRHGKALNGARVLILGVAYKKNVDDMRESPAAEIMHRIAERGAEISYSDPHVPVFPPMRNYDFDLSSVELTPETLSNQDAVVLVTNHDRFDYDLIKQHAPLLIDTRGIYREPADNIIRA